ncbi:MAG: hypothetical protein K0S61_578 [Anaerocolumna sp.]|jgi:hypothetical protein|nr:hypothetical protein [Anaerocolumna sp.]
MIKTKLQEFVIDTTTTKGMSRMVKIVSNDDALAEFCYNVDLDVRKFDRENMSENELKKEIRKSAVRQRDDIMTCNKEYHVEEVKKGVFVVKED